MKTLGLDIGTTSVSAVVCHGGVVLDSRTVESKAFISTDKSWEKIQDVALLLSLATGLVDELLAPDVERIGITGQQHGIVYLDAAGNALSPLYIWQDGRGDLPFEAGLSYAKYITEQTGYKVASGYGLVTHFYNVRNGLVPEGAVTFCTIHDFVAMKLAGLNAPAIDASDAASFGLFDIQKGCFDLGAVEKLGLNTSILPALAKEPCIGSYKGRNVYVAIGDNQASFIGATGGASDAVLANIGTGSQVSIHCPSYTECSGLETRPFPLGGCLLVGASLCGGRAYALLDEFFCSVTKAVTGSRPNHCYEAMFSLVEGHELDDVPTVSPLFQGTRQNPDERASISNLSTDNFTPAHLVKGMFDGMAEELAGMYRMYSTTSPANLFGAGNALRLNPALRESVQKSFAAELKITSSKEEAALGSAIFASIS